MGQKKWTTDEQEEWLSEQIPNFVQAQKDKSSSKFFAPIYSEFHRLWQYREPMEEEIKAQKNKDVEEEDTESANNGAMAKAKAIIFHDENKVHTIFLLTMKS
jgi:hypothetical protein